MNWIKWVSVLLLWHASFQFVYRRHITDVDNMNDGALHNVLVFYVNGEKASANMKFWLFKTVELFAIN